jgi:hypothetical protein
MRIMAMFTSSLESLGAWRAQRLPLARYVPLALLIAWAACGSMIASARGLALVVLALSLIAQCRLWDDLVDRKRDRSAHPSRLLAAAGTIDAYVNAVVVLATLNALALALMLAWPRALGAVMLFAAVALWYRCHRTRGLVHAHILLLKYPAFVLLLAESPFATQTLAAALVVYAAMCAFEILDAHLDLATAGRSRYLPFVCAIAALFVIHQGVEG